MRELWVMMIVVWAIAECVQILRKKPYPKRMWTGAIWGVALASLAALGQTDPATSSFTFLPVAFAIFGSGALVIIGVRTLAHKLLTRGRASTEPAAKS